jgi:ATP-dependent DNA helicase RecQ
LKYFKPIYQFEKRLSLMRLNLLNYFTKNKIGKFGIIYCHEKKDTYKVSEFMNKHGHIAKPFHGGMRHHEKSEVQQAFINGECNVIASTIAFGMGIDKPDVSFVAHLRLPASLEGYVQEIGRAGRDGDHADCALIFSVHDAAFHASANKRKSGVHGQAAFEALEAMTRLVNEEECLHQQIASYFGESAPSCLDSPADKRKPCTVCDRRRR